MTTPAPDPYPDAFLVLTGGTGSRLGGVDKASLEIGSQRLVDRAVTLADGRPVIVIGPTIDAPGVVAFTREDPPGGGPAAGVAAGAAVIERDLRLPATALIAIVAVDQAGVTAATWRRLTIALGGGRAATLVHDGRRHIGVTVARWGPLREVISAQPSWYNQPLRRLIDPLIDVEVSGGVVETRDVDTLADLEWWRSRTARGQE